MERYYLVAIVTLLTGILIFGMAFTVTRTHSKTGILAPVMTGDPLLERSRNQSLVRNSSCLPDPQPEEIVNRQGVPLVQPARAPTLKRCNQPNHLVRYIGAKGAEPEQECAHQAPLAGALAVAAES